MGAIKYYKGLDGIRGMAVLMVMLFHTHLLPFGWVGVQLFFVLSGFLITSILVSQRDRTFGQFVGGFYWRRSLRIWPLYFSYIGFCVVLFAVLGVPEQLPGEWPWLLTYTDNFRQIWFPNLSSDYYNHFWTLAIEEQFYLVWPFVVFFLPRKWFGWLIWLIILTGPAIRYETWAWFSKSWGDINHLKLVVHNLPTSHMDGFAAGALLTTIPPAWRAGWGKKSPAILTGVLTVAVVLGGLQTYLLWRAGLPVHVLGLGYGRMEYFGQYIWGYTVLNLCSIALIFCVVTGAGCARFLEFRPLVFMGTISYGLYVFHLPIFRILETHWPTVQDSAMDYCRFVVFALATMTAAVTSYYFFELRFLRLKQRVFPYKERNLALTGWENDKGPSES
jgi:peptidoglycan/LPS O-acetylase OafA/YrhL